MKLLEFFNKQQPKVIVESIDHPEDLIISNGAAGAEHVVKELAGLGKDTTTVSIKWDGFPAVIFGRDASGQLVFTDKHMYDKIAKGKLDWMTIREYDKQRDANRSDLWEKEDILRPLLAQMVPKVTDKYWMGDLMWSGTPDTNNGFFSFKPNTVEYQVKVDSPLGHKIAKSAGGIAVHTMINGLGANDIPLKGLQGLPSDGGIVFLTGEMTDKPTVTVNPQLLKETESIIQQHKDVVDKFMNDLTAMKAKMVITAMGPFITSMLDQGDIKSDIVPRFIGFLKGRLSAPAAKKLLGNNQDGWLYQSNGGAPGLLGIWSMWAAVTDLKIHVKQQIDTQQQGSEIRAFINGAESHEGYVFGAGKGKLKIIDRLGFSAANFAKFTVSDEERKSKEEMPLGAFCFGRMNPPTIGHKEVMAKTIETGGTNSFIFVSSSQGPDDPLDVNTKIAFIKKIYPQFAKYIVTEPVQNPIFGANYLYDKGFRNIAFIAGSDRLGTGQGSLEKLLNSWNSGPIRTTDNARGSQGREHVNLTFVSSGERDPDATGISGVSGTLARKYATDENEKGFNQATGVNGNIEVNGRTLYQAVRDGLGIKDEPKMAQQTNQVNEPAVEGFDPIDTPLKRFMIKQIARVTGHSIDKLSKENDTKIEDLFLKYVPGSEQKIEKFNQAIAEITIEHQDRMAGVGMGNYKVDEKMLSKNAFVGSKKNPIGGKGLARGEPKKSQKAPLTGLLVGEDHTIEDTRLDPKCWDGYKKQGTKIKGNTRVNNCVKVGEGWELQISQLIRLLESK